MLTEIDRQIVNSWRHRLRAKGAAASSRGPCIAQSRGPRIAVVGNCQSFGIAYGMKVLNPASVVERFTIVRPGWANLDILARTLRNFDHVFSLDFEEGFVRGGGSARLREMLPNIVPFPTVVFSGFHPDTIYLLDPTRGGMPIECPTGPYHSALIVYGFLRGMSVEQTMALFSEQTFKMLGYLNVWDDSATQFLSSAKASGLDLDNDFLRWSRRGCFMYSHNHPKAHVLFDIGRALLDKAGLPAGQLDFDDFAVDDIVRGAVFPLYPEIAAHLGLRGSYLFKQGNYRLSRTVGEFLDLKMFTEASFAIYAQHKREALHHPRLEGWLNDPETVRALDWLSADGLARKSRAGV